MNFLRTPILILLMVVGHLLSFSQAINYSVPQFTRQLSSNEVRFIFQDRTGLIWIGTSDGLSSFDGYELKSVRTTYDTREELPSNKITCMDESDAYLWIGTEKGLSVLDKSSRTISVYPDRTFLNNHVRTIKVDSKNNIWIRIKDKIYRCSERKIEKEYPITVSANSLFEASDGSLYLLPWEGRLMRYDSNNDRFVEINAPKELTGPFSMMQDHNGMLWITTWGNGLWEYNPKMEAETAFKRHRLYDNKRSREDTIMYDMVQDDTFGYYWIMSYQRLYVMRRTENGSLEEVDINKANTSLSPIDIYRNYSKLLKDNAGNLWLGAYDQTGLITFHNERVHNYPLPEIEEITGLDPNIIAIAKDNGGIVWMKQARYGLCTYDEQTGIFNKGEIVGDRKNSCILVPDDAPNGMWFAGGKKLELLSSANMKMGLLKKYDLPIKGVDEVETMTKDSSGHLWIASPNAFLRFDIKSGKFARLDIPGITTLHYSNDGAVWGMTSNKLYKFIDKGRSIEIHTYPIRFREGTLNHLTDFAVDASGKLWISTLYDEILEFNGKTIANRTKDVWPNGGEIKRLTTFDDQLWIASNKIISNYSFTTGKRESFSVNDNNILLDSFRYGAIYASPGGKIYAGGHNGFISIDPYGSTSNNFKTTPFIYDILVDNESYLGKKNDGKDSDFNTVELDSDAKNIRIGFSAMNYSDAHKVNYAYKMDGVDKDWVTTLVGRPSAFYNSLPKGKHTFHVKAAGPNGEWGKETTITIYRKAAFHETWIALMLLIAAVALLGWWLITKYNRRVASKNRVKMQEELTQTKLNYFANISHELLTPLTIISCVTDNIETAKTANPSDIATLKANIARLKRLLQQVLDFRKLEDGKMRMRVEKRNISTFIKEVTVTNFEPLAQQKDIHLSSDIQAGIWGYLDFGKLDKILFNLLSNAIKYTPEHKDVRLIVKEETVEGKPWLKIVVEDDGQGIASKELESIFSRFYHNRHTSGNESNGIGLSLTKQLTEIHHGSISVESELGKGSRFMVKLPVYLEAYTPEELMDQGGSSSAHESEDGKGDKAAQLPMVLFVDDNRDLRVLSADMLTPKYHVLTAENGAKALDILKKHRNVDVIVCDVMMPVMDGLQFCRTVKEDVELNHIPVIMLTAKNASADRIECYNAGADSYIAKPFESQLLLSRIDNLLQSREHRHASFASETEIEINEEEYQPADKKFLEDAIAFVTQHLEDPELDVDMLAENFFMSPSTLRRKLRVYTGLSPLNFIRNIRLKLACRLLKDPNLNIAEVGYKCGFSTPRNFTRSFKEAYNMTPSEYQSRNTSE